MSSDAWPGIYYNNQNNNNHTPMKYENKIQEYIENNGSIGERHEEPKPPVSIALAKPETTTSNEPKQEAPKKKRGRPVGSKNSKPAPQRIQHTITLSPELHKIVSREAKKNFRPLSNEIQYILTMYYNGEL